jgi:hypothetical protein
MFINQLITGGAYIVTMANKNKDTGNVSESVLENTTLGRNGYYPSQYLLVLFLGIFR